MTWPLTAFLLFWQPSVKACYSAGECHEIVVREGWAEVTSPLFGKDHRLGRFEHRYADRVDALDLPTAVSRLGPLGVIVTAWGFSHGVDMLGPMFSCYLFSNTGQRLLKINGDLRLVTTESFSVRGTKMLIVVSASSHSWTYLTTVVRLSPRPAVVHRTGEGRPKLDRQRLARGLLDFDLPERTGLTGPIHEVRTKTLFWDNAQGRFRDEVPGSH